MKLRKISLLCMLIMVLVVSSACSLTKDNDKEKISENNTKKTEEVTPDDPTLVISDSIDLLKGGNLDTIKKYFGDSDVFSPDTIKDRLSLSKVTFIEHDKKDEVDENTTDSAVNSEGLTDTTEGALQVGDLDSNDTSDSNSTEGGIEDKDLDIVDKDIDSNKGVQNGDVEVLVHICTVDYNKTKAFSAQSKSRLATENPLMTVQEIENEVKIETANKLANGDFDVHYTVPVIVNYKDGIGDVNVSEAFKAALTGNWYTGLNVELEEVECPLKMDKTIVEDIITE